MSYRNPREQGEKLPLDQRTGLSHFPPLRGVKKSKSPAAIPDNQFDHLVNVRIKKRFLRERGGLVKGASNAFPGVQGIHDASDIGTPIAGVAAGDGFGYARGGFQGHTPGTYPSWTVLGNINVGLVTDFNLDIDLDDAIQFARVCPDKFEGRVYMDSVSRTAIYSYAGITDELVEEITLEADETAVYGSCVLSGVFYFLAFVDTFDTRVYSWDGVTKTLDETLTTGDMDVGPLYTVGSEIYAYGAGVIHRRSAGGAWSTIAYPTDTLYYSIPVLYGGLVYFAGECTTTTPALGVVDSFNGTTISRARTLPEVDASATSGSGAHAACVFNSKLYVAWGAPRAGYDGTISGGGDPRNAVLAEFTGAAWTDEQADFVVFDQYGPTLVLFTDGTDLYLVSSGTDDDIDVGHHHFFWSAGTDTTSWDKFAEQDDGYVPGNEFQQQVPVVLLTGAIF